MRVPPWVKPGVWGAVIGAVAMMSIGFSWWGWVLGSTAERMASARANAALVKAFAPICVDRFMVQADAPTQLADFQKTSPWWQRGLVEKGGWATLISARIRLGFLDNTSLCSNWWLRLLAFIPAIEYGDRLGRQLL